MRTPADSIQRPAGSGGVFFRFGLCGDPELGEVDTEPFPQASVARLGHGDDPAGFPGGDPAPFGQRAGQGFAVPYLVDGLGAVSGRTGAFGLLTAIIAVLALWTTGYAILSGRASPPASESDAPIGESRPVRQENSLLPNGQRRPVPGTHTLPG